MKNTGMVLRDLGWQEFGDGPWDISEQKNEWVKTGRAHSDWVGKREESLLPGLKGHAQVFLFYLKGRGCAYRL